MNDSALPYRELAQRLITRFTIHPDHITVASETVGNGTHIYIAVQGHPDDQGLLIGKDGNNARSIQSILSMAAQANRHTLSYRIAEPKDGERGTITEFKQCDHWTEKQMVEVRNILLSTLKEITHANVKVENHLDDKGDTFIVVVPDKTFPISVENALNTIFRAIGRKAGRKISVNIKRI